MCEDGTIWFLSNDVTGILGYKNNSKALTDHTSGDDRKPLKYVDCNDSLLSKMWLGKDRKDKVFVNESGLYCLIFGSKLPKAQAFKFWVTREVLPSIRKNGGYILGQEKLSTEEREKLEQKIAKLHKEIGCYTEDTEMLQKYYEDILQMYKDLKKKIEGQESDDAVREPVSEVKFYDQYGNVYTSREEAIEAMRAFRD